VVISELNLFHLEGNRPPLASSGLHVPRGGQPAGTLVMLEGGLTSPIEKLRIGDRVVSYNRLPGHGAKAHLAGLKTQGRRVLDIVAFAHDGDLVRVEAQSHTGLYSPDHTFLVKIREDSLDRYAVYIMIRGITGRVGCSKLWYPSSSKEFGPAMRARQERADATWVLSDYATRREALNAERVVTGKYGLLMQIFRHPGNLDVEITQDDIDLIIDGIGDNTDRVREALNGFGRDIRHPIWTRDGSIHISTTYPFLSRGSNLLAGVMSVGVVSDTNSVEWTPVTISREPHRGLLYTLEVETHRIYVGNGIVS
jgi:hypothetical protein